MGKHAEHSMHVSSQKPSQQCDYSYYTHSQVRKSKFTVQFIYFSLLVSVAIEKNPKKDLHANWHMNCQWCVYI